MRKLNLFLHSNYFLLLLLLLSFLYIYYSFHNIHSNYTENDEKIKGIVLSKKIENEYITLEIKGKEKILVSYYLKEKKLNNEINIGDTIMVEGKLKKPNKNRNFSLFNYQNYLKSKKIFWIMNASKISKLKNAKGFYQLKNRIIKRIEKQNNSSFLKAFLLGDSKSLEEKKQYQELGISHLFAVSGMHITFITSFLFFLGGYFSKNKIIVFSFVTVILALYLQLLYDSPSASRAFLLFIFSYLNKHYHLNFSTLKLLIFVFFILVLKNPFVILQTGFQFSFLICFFLLLQKKEKSSYLKTLFQTSLLASIASFPLSVYTFHQFYFASIFCNLIAVPFVSLLLFPFSFICFIFPSLHVILTFFIHIFHFILNIFSSFSIFKITFPSISILYLFLYYLIITLIFVHNKKWIIIFLILTSFHISYPYLDNHYYIDVIDVGQGDSILIRFPHLSKTILIDTGGLPSYEQKKQAQVDDILLPYLKALGIKKINILIITHGDSDHIGNALELVNKIPTLNVYMNSHSRQEQEKQLISYLEKKKITYKMIGKQNIMVEKQIFQFLNRGDSEDENEDSLVLYTKLAKKNILFMGDAGEKTENRLIQEYNLPKMDILKVGHHGSNTSSKEKFLEKIKPTISLISSKENNRYGHPHFEVLERLRKNGSFVLTTKDKGAIRIRLGDKMKIWTCLP